MAKEAWNPVWAVAMVVLREFGLLIVLCRNGKHRSLSLAYELAQHTRAQLVSIIAEESQLHRRGRTTYRDLNAVMDDVSPRLKRHIEVFGYRPHPVVGLQVCEYNFCGCEWAMQYVPEEERFDTVYHCLIPGDILVELSRSEKESAGWRHGVFLCDRDISPDGWYPPLFVLPKLLWKFWRFINLLESLKMKAKRHQLGASTE